MCECGHVYCFRKLVYFNRSQGKLLTVNQTIMKSDCISSTLCISVWPVRLNISHALSKVQHMLMKAKGYDVSTSESPKDTGYNENQMVDKRAVHPFFAVM